VYTHADIFSAGHKGVPPQKRLSETLTLYSSKRPFILRQVTGKVLIVPAHGESQGTDTYLDGYAVYQELTRGSAVARVLLSRCVSEGPRMCE
jgi:hypothetical protein